MSRRRDHAIFSTDNTARGWRSLRSDRVRRREHEQAEAELIGDLHWQWRSVCLGTTLKQIVYTPSGTTMAVPRIGSIDLGPPISFTVRVRAGQTVADFEAAAPQIVSAMNVAGLRVTQLAPQWVRITLLSAGLVAVPDRSSGLDVETLRSGA